MGRKKNNLLKTNKQNNNKTPKTQNQNAIKSESTKKRQEAGSGAGGFGAENINKCCKSQSKETHMQL